MGSCAGFISFPGGSEWIIIFLVILIIFGPKSLPKVGQAIGRGIREFKDASDGITRAIEEETSSDHREHENSHSPGDSAESGEPTEHTD